MATSTANPATELDVRVGKNGIHVQLPRSGSDVHYMETLEELMRLNDLHGPAVWEIDLSNQDGIPLALASVLMGFGNHARSLGGDVRFTGITENFISTLVGKREWARCFSVAVSRDGKNREVALRSF